MVAAGLNVNAPHGGGHQDASSSSRSLPSQVHDAASVVGSRIQDAVSQLNLGGHLSRRGPAAAKGAGGLKDGWDSLVSIVFAPCAGDLNVGGVPRDEAAAVPAATTSAAAPLQKGRGGGASRSPPAPSWGASVPFDVSVSQIGTSSLVAKDSSFGGRSQRTRDGELPAGLDRRSPGRPRPVPEQRASTPRERRRAESRARLKRLGARHQLAGGFPGESLAEEARPVSPAEREAERLRAERSREEVEGVADFDDGISAISSHTLEDMERRRQARERRTRAQASGGNGGGGGATRGPNVLRLHPLDFHQIIEEEAAGGRGGATGFDPASPGGIAPAVSEERDTEVVFGEPFYEEEEAAAPTAPAAASNPSPPDPAVARHVRTVVDPSSGVAHDEFVPHPLSSRTRSANTAGTAQNTTATEESHEFEEMRRRDEAAFWSDEGMVGAAERARERRTGRAGRGMSIEERARRLRELSRSRSRSDGTGSSNKSGSSSLVSSGRHPHDTVPVYSSDLFSRRKRSGGSRGGGSMSGRSSRRSSSSGGGRAPRRGGGGAVTSSSVMEESDPFASLDYGEI
ncbi:hypothetical protein ACHAWF_017508 [Thalassiosira exigua]